jgi:hypothetical protein
MGIFLHSFCLLLVMTSGSSAPNTMASGFVLFPERMHIKQDLLQITETQNDKLLKVTLQIGEEEGPRMAVTDMMVELHHEPADSDEHTTLPGADGEHAKLSTGHRRLDLISEGHFINLQGTQKVKMTKGCWEMCWRDDKPAGTLICGFDLPEDYQRNDAILPQGELYVSFPLWTRGGLKIGQEEKRKVELEMETYLEARDEALVAFDATENPIMKAIHLRNAFSATDKYNGIDRHTLETIPMDHQVFEIQDDILLSEKGLIWTKDWECKRGGGHILLGYANVEPGSRTPKSRLMP